MDAVLLFMILIPIFFIGYAALWLVWWLAKIVVEYLRSKRWIRWKR